MNSVDWPPLLARYLWAVAAREALGSQRWSGETKTLVVMTFGPALALLILMLELWWVLTGRGRRLRHMLAQDVVVAMPFPHRLPAGFSAQLAEIRARHGAEPCHGARMRRSGEHGLETP
jgi:hypothetical protein